MRACVLWLEPRTPYKLHSMFPRTPVYALVFDGFRQAIMQGLTEFDQQRLRDMQGLQQQQQHQIQQQQQQQQYAQQQQLYAQQQQYGSKDVCDDDNLEWSIGRGERQDRVSN